MPLKRTWCQWIVRPCPSTCPSCGELMLPKGESAEKLSVASPHTASIPIVKPGLRQINWREVFNWLCETDAKLPQVGRWQQGASWPRSLGGDTRDTGAVGSSRWAAGPSVTAKALLRNIVSLSGCAGQTQRDPGEQGSVRAHSGGPRLWGSPKKRPHWNKGHHRLWMPAGWAEEWFVSGQNHLWMCPDVLCRLWCCQHEKNWKMNTC